VFMEISFREAQRRAESGQVARIHESYVVAHIR